MNFMRSLWPDAIMITCITLIPSKEETWAQSLSWTIIAVAALVNIALRDANAAGDMWLFSGVSWVLRGIINARTRKQNP